MGVGSIGTSYIKTETNMSAKRSAITWILLILDTNHELDTNRKPASESQPPINAVFITNKRIEKFWCS